LKSGIIIIGSEITSGRSRDTNSNFIARRLTESGLKCVIIVEVPDDIEAIRDAIKELLNKGIDMIVTTGGLGSTHDDVTREALAEALDTDLLQNEDLVSRLKKFMPQNADVELFMKQAYLPQGARPILLDRGTAPGLMIRVDRSIIVAVPGVPSEMKDMLEIAIDSIEKENDNRSYIHTGSLNVFGPSEPELAKLVEQILTDNDDIEFTILAEIDKIQIIFSKISDDLEDEQRIDSIKGELLKLLADRVYSEGSETIQEVVARQFLERGLTLSVAESCTGGMISKRITDVPGSSRIFLGGIAAYSDSIKSAALNVSHETLSSEGAVSAKVAVQMCTGIKKIAGSDIALSVTGIAGPDSDTSGKPVGLVYICISDNQGNDVQKHMFYGSRDMIRRKTTQTALNMLRLHTRT